MEDFLIYPAHAYDHITKDFTPLKVLVTRPAEQATRLVAVIQAYGGTAISFPTLEITAVKKNSLLKQIETIDNYDFVIFLSPNTVLKTTDFIKKICYGWPVQTKTIAIGSGTANALKEQGLPVDYYPEKNFSSEGLLQLSSLQNLKQKKILILQGEKGRGYLEKELKKKGAQVITVNTYARRCPNVSKANIPDPGTVNVILCTSNTGLKNLLILLKPYWKKQLFNKQLLVISQRIADCAKKLGFVKQVIISDNAGQVAILQALWMYAKEGLHRGVS